MGKITMLAAGAAGYVLGARAGRERYEQIAAQARSVWGDPRVQQRKEQATTAVKETAVDLGQQAASVAKEKATEAKDAVQEKASGGETGASSVAPPPPAAPVSTPTPDPSAPAPGTTPGGETTAAFPVDPANPGEPGRHV